MFSRSVSQQMKRIDLTRRIPMEERVSTLPSTVLSYLSLLLILTLVCYESCKQWSVHHSSHLHLDQRGSATFEIHIDIMMHRLPCALASLDLENSVNAYRVNMNIRK